MKNHCEICDAPCWGATCSLECSKLYQAELDGRFGKILRSQSE